MDGAGGRAAFGYHRTDRMMNRALLFASYRLRIASVLRDYEMDKRAQVPEDSKKVHG